MRNNIRIAIPKPCQEKYNSFMTTANGGFCSSCQKEVIDFSSWSEERIKSYFKDRHGNTCGRFREDQLKVYSYGNPGRTGINGMSVVFAGFLLFFSSRQLSAQTTPTRTTEQYEPEVKRENIKRARRPTVTVFGTVTSREDALVMSGVKVMLKGTSTETSTDAVGKFRLDLPNNDSTRLIVFSFAGFKTVEYIHDATRPGQEIAIEMTHQDLENIEQFLTGILGGVRVRAWYEPREIARDVWWWLTGR